MTRETRALTRAWLVRRSQLVNNEVRSVGGANLCDDGVSCVSSEDCRFSRFLWQYRIAF